MSSSKYMRLTPKHECEICGKVFRRRRELFIHGRVHSDERPYDCDKCGRAFKYISSFRVHLEIAHGIRGSTVKSSDRDNISQQRPDVFPMKCSVCKRGFMNSTTLKYHMKIHGMPKIPKLKTTSLQQHTSSPNTTTLQNAYSSTKTTASGILESVKSAAASSAFIHNKTAKVSADRNMYDMFTSEISSTSAISEDTAKVQSESVGTNVTEKDRTQSSSSMGGKEGTQSVELKRPKANEMNDAAENFQTAHKAFLNDAIEERENPDSNQETLKTKGNIADIHFCRKCFMMFKNKISLDKHACNTGECKCPYCGKEFPSQISLRQHVKRWCKRYRENFAAKHFRCIHCQRSFPSEISLRQHQSRWCKLASSKMFRCPNCHRTFTSLISVRKHLSRWCQHVPQNMSKSMFRCPNCNIGFSSEISLRQHMARSCRKYITSSFVTQPDNTEPETGGQPGTFECGFCQQKFTSMFSLTRHKRTHKKFYQCSVCKECFDTKEQQTRHSFTNHVRQQRYGCPHCTGTFGDRANLHRHITKIHKYEEERRKAKAMEVHENEEERRKTNAMEAHKYKEERRKANAMEVHAYEEERRTANAMEVHNYEEKSRKANTMETHMYEEERRKVNATETHKYEEERRKANTMEAHEYEEEQSDTNAVEQENVPVGNSNNYRCSQCSCTYSQEYLLRKHVMRVHWKEDNKRNKQNQLEQRNAGRSNNSQKEIPSIEYNCNTCGASFTRRDNLRRHIDNVHFGGIINSEWDNNRFKKPQPHPNKEEETNKLNTAVTTSPDIEYFCDTCGTGFNRQANLRRHISNVHFGGNLYRNPKSVRKEIEPDKIDNTPSPRTIYSPSVQNNEVTSGTPTRKIPNNRLTNYEKMKLLNKEILKDYFVPFNSIGHYKRFDATGQLLYVCEVCELTYTYKENLARHIRNRAYDHGIYLKKKTSHRGHPQQRNQIDRSCNVSQTLKLKAGHKCDVCGFSYTRRYNMMIHRKQHTDAEFEQAGVRRDAFTLQNKILDFNESNNLQTNRNIDSAVNSTSEVFSADDMIDNQTTAESVYVDTMEVQDKELDDIDNDCDADHDYDDDSHLYTAVPYLVSQNGQDECTNDSSIHTEPNLHRTERQNEVHRPSTTVTENNIQIGNDKKTNGHLESEEQMSTVEKQGVGGHDDTVNALPRPSAIQGTTIEILSTIGDSRACTSCKLPFLEGQRTVKCRLCDQVFCISCTAIPRDVYEAMINKDDCCIAGLWWTCSVCRHLVPKFTVLIQQLGKYEQIINNRLSDIDQKLVKMFSSRNQSAGDSGR